jgi:two-component system phosphate regulon sensor histidine kinase PhoR
MAELGPELPPGWRPNLATWRFFEWRWPLAGLAAALLLLVALGSVAWWAAILIFAVVAILLALPQRQPAQSESAAPSGQEPNSAVMRFAEALPEPCYLLDAAGIVRFANARARSAFPLKVGDLLTARLRAPDLVAALQSVAAGGGAVGVEFFERVPTERWFTAWFAPLGTPAGEKPETIVLVIDDLTEQRRAERARADFVANASHELRTPLASLTGFIETLQGPAKDDPAARERFLSIMHGQSQRMSRLIDDLLSLNRIEMKVHMRPQDPVDVVAVLQHVLDAFEPLAAELGVSMESEIPEAHVIVQGDRDELVQVFSNLLENALKYGRSGKRVVVSLIRPSGPRSACLVSVRDFGPGIGAEHLPRLTERFYRVDDDRQSRGTGLGLAIVKHILNRHRARLSIESEPGQGALFSVRFDESTLSAPATPRQEKVT